MQENIKGVRVRSGKAMGRPTQEKIERGRNVRQIESKKLHGK